MSQPPFKMTPMYEHYLRIKSENPGGLLFYRMGDFYELFFDDAVTAARELQLTLTSRHKDDSVPMCGVPWHSVLSYINQLVEKGYTVTLCDQVEDPRQAKGLVKREVTQVFTSATTLEDACLDAKSHNYLGALFWGGESGGFAWMDSSTGFWTGLQSSKEADLWQWVFKLAPRELLVPEGLALPETLKLVDAIQVVRVPYRGHFEPKQALERVLAAQGAADAASLGLERRPELAQACGALVAYLSRVLLRDPSHLAPFRPLDTGRYLILDEVTERNLELFTRFDGRKGPGTLWHALDHTITPMGGRLLEERLRYPWRELEPIAQTQDAVAYFLAHPDERATLRERLDRVRDVERLSTRVLLNRCQPRDLEALRESLYALPGVRAAMLGSEPGAAQTLLEADEEGARDLPSALYRLLRTWDDMADLADLLGRALVDALPLQATDGGLFRQGYHPQLDELLDLVEHGEARLQDLLRAEQEANSLPRLKLGYNRVFGYYFELGKSQKDAPVPPHFQRRQTVATGERYVTGALKDLEERLLSAAEARKSLEYELYRELREAVIKERPRLLLMGHLLAQADYWQSMAEVAARNDWARPDVHEGNDIDIQRGRHPVVEAIIGRAAFIPNNIHIDDARRLVLITGPNMAGKSTILRQTALICLLAQMGAFVPAASARVGLVDRIFSRVGASDNLAQGRSTFMVEMTEAARILRQATRRSLVILDEIGRGTSTFDGLAIAWAMVEDLSRRAGGHIRTLFATHYHELTALAGSVPGVHNMSVAVTEKNGDITFTRRLVPGPADRSYGVEVARLAGVPMPVVQRAREIMADLERTRGASPRPERLTLPGLAPPAPPPPAPSPPPAPEHPLLEALRDLDLNLLTPMAALNQLAEWKSLWGDHE